MSRLLGLDIGVKRIGVAISDETQQIASPFEVIESKGWGPDTLRIKHIYDENHVSLIVCGLPKNMDGTEGFQAQTVRKFAEQLEVKGMKVAFMDERLSTVTAERSLIGASVHRSDRKEVIDKVAAAIILQQYLDKTNSEFERKKQIMKDEENIFQEEYDEDSIIELTDEDGITTRFEHLATIEDEGKEYLILEIIPDDEEVPINEDEGEIAIFEIQQDENDEDIYVPVEDDLLCEKLFKAFTEFIDNEEPFED